MRNTAKGSAALWLRRNPVEYVNTTLNVGRNNIDKKLDIPTSSLQPKEVNEKVLMTNKVKVDANHSPEFKELQSKNKVINKTLQKKINT